MPNDMQTANVSGLSAYPASPQVTIPFDPTGVLIVNEHATEVVFISFDGTNNHGKLIPGTMSAVEWKYRGRKVWIKPTSSGTASPVNVSVISEG